VSEQQRCECGQAWFNEPMGVWLQEIARGNMQGQAEGFCAKCGCRLSVVDGEPVVGEKYADLAYAAQANPSNRLAQSMRMLAQDVEIIDALRARVAELEAALKLERGAVEILGVELETRSGICACDVQDGWEQHRGGNTVGACWAAWARALAEAGSE